MPDGHAALTEKEKQTLRLIVRGHDAKSTARALGLSVHTINERLREARRKMAVSSSREAARLLFEQEEAPPEKAGHKPLGEAIGPGVDEVTTPPEDGRERGRRLARIAIGATLMLIALAAIALSALPQLTSSPTSAPSAEDRTVAATDADVVNAAQRWLVLLDGSRWADSYAETSKSFRKLNTLQIWTSASEQARAPLGATITRTLLSQEDLPAPPHGYQVVKFRTNFASKPNAVETVSLDREDGVWRVVGVYIS